MNKKLKRVGIMAEVKNLLKRISRKYLLKKGILVPFVGRLLKDYSPIINVDPGSIPRTTNDPQSPTRYDA